MTIKEMKDWLSQAQFYWLEIEKINERKLQLESLREKVTPSYSLAPGGGGGFTHSKIEDITVKILTLNDSFDRQIKRYLQAYNNIKLAIGLLENVNLRYMTILNQKYLDLASWDDLAVSFAVSRRQIIYQHEKAIKALCDIMNAEGSKLLKE